MGKYMKQLGNSSNKQIPAITRISSTKRCEESCTAKLYTVYYKHSNYAESSCAVKILSQLLKKVYP